MELSVFERLVLLNVLPSEGDILTIRAIREVRQGLEFTDEEHKTLQFKRLYECSECSAKIEMPAIELGVPQCPKCDKRMSSTPAVQWLTDADQDKNIDISNTGRGIVKSTLIQLNEQKLLTERHLSIYDKFVEG